MSDPTGTPETPTPVKETVWPARLDEETREAAPAPALEVPAAEPAPATPAPEVSNG
jgi:hypothetical protein